MVKEFQCSFEMNESPEPSPQRHSFPPTPSMLASSRHNLTLNGMAPLSSVQDPYWKYEGEHRDSSDDGINLDLSLEEGSESASDGDGASLPPPDIISREFTDYVEAMSPMSDPEQEAILKTTPEERWRLITNQRARSPVLPLHHYLSNLRRQTSGSQRSTHRFSWPKRNRDNTNLVLRKLKADMKMSPESFVHEFVRNEGMKHLVDLLREIQTNRGACMTTKKARSDELKQWLADEYDCLLCIKFACRVQEALQHLMQLKGALDSIGQCLIGDMVKSRVLTLQILEDVCDLPGGFQSVMTLMSSIRLKYGENVRFKLLMGALNSSGEAHVQFIGSCVRFLNKLVSCSESVNATVYLQYELQLAGFEPGSLNKYSYGDTPESEALSKQLGIWHAGYIDVQTYQSVLAKSESRSLMLRDEVNRLQEQLKKTEQKIRHLEHELKTEHTKCDQYRERAAELQDTVTKLNRAYRRQAGPAAWEIAREVPLDEAMKPLDVPEARDTRSNSDASIRTEQGSDSPLVISPPPAPPPITLLSQTVRHKVMSHANMPSLNWTPLKDITGSVFQNIDCEKCLREIDFSTFEETFKLPNNPSKDGKAKRLSFQTQLDPSLISFIDTNRAKNMSITKRKTGLSNEQLEDAINQCRADILPGEMAELLLKFIPTREELIAISHHKGEEERLGEPEKFIAMLSRIERLETKLQLLTYMGQFNELIDSIKPQITRVCEASNSVFNSERLRRVFEIILAFGNYMNSSKRGYVFGFHLESLYKLVDVKSTARDHTLLHFIVGVFSLHYPELLDFDSDIDFGVPKGVSYQALVSDVLELRRGTDLMKSECEKQPENQQLEEFFQNACLKVAEVAEMFKRMEDAYRNVCQLFGENFRLTEPDDLFKVLADFASNFRIAVQDNFLRSQGHNVTGYLGSSDLPKSPAARIHTPLSPGDAHFYVQTSPRLQRSSTEQSPFEKLPTFPVDTNLSILNTTTDSSSDLGICIDNRHGDAAEPTGIPPVHKNIFQNVLQELASTRHPETDEEDDDRQEDYPDGDSDVPLDTLSTSEVNQVLDTLDQVVFEAECDGEDTYMALENETTPL